MWEQMWERIIRMLKFSNKNSNLYRRSGGDEGIRTLETLPGLLP